jgi:uncharacterized repeat protein (TIGR03847 family)
MDLEHVDRITADAVGEPGSRVFYLQMRSGPEVVSVVLEKQQLQLLSASIEELLGQVDRPTDVLPDVAGGLEEPLEPLWRVGRLSLGYHEDLDLVLLEVVELLPEDEDEDDAEDEAGEREDVETAVPGTTLEAPSDAQRIRVWATREQMLALARHGASVVAAGRPLCPYCGNPLDPSGHVCPAMNGHGSPTP